jgi:predicted secreted protein
MSDAKAGIGTTLKFGSPQTTMPEMTNFSWDGLSLGEAEVTHYLSPDFYREFIATLKDPGVWSCETNFLADDAAYTALTTAFENRSVETWELSHSDFTGKYTVSGFVRKLTPFSSAPIDGAIKAAVEIRLSGKPTFA